MFEDFFIIPQNEIDENWKPIDLSYDFFEDVNYTYSGLEINLKSFEKR